MQYISNHHMLIMPHLWLGKAKFKFQPQVHVERCGDLGRIPSFLVSSPTLAPIFAISDALGLKHHSSGVILST